MLPSPCCPAAALAAAAASHTAAAAALPGRIIGVEREMRLPVTGSQSHDAVPHIHSQYYYHPDRHDDTPTMVERDNPLFLLTFYKVP